ncbi:hypothetical protein Tco_0875333 [Tanacetum coccineum]|uniref:Uncharacterized protein n=1 Tax=Tanacetum coccineum TaxID=301880 RepID=A0ABQ5BS14_9ASTR
MTRSSNSYEEPEREFRSSRRHFKSLSLDELRSPNFNLFSDQEYSEEEEAEAMAEIMNQYMSKTRTGYGSGVARPKIEEMIETYSKASQIDESIPQKEKDPGSFTLLVFFINNVCFDNALVDLGASVSVMPLLTYLNLGLGELAHTKLTVELADMTVKYPKVIAENVLVRIGKFIFLVDLIILDMPEDIKVPLILEILFLSTARAKINVYKRKITLRVGEENIIFKSVKSASSLIKRVYMLSLRERMELDLEARLMGETLVNQGDDLMSTIEEGKVIEEFRTRDEDLDTGIDDYPNKMVYKGDNVVGALMNVPIFVGTFSVMTDFAVLEDMDTYRDEGMGDVIVGEPFLREVGIKARRFDGMITIYNGNDEVTTKMVRIKSRYQDRNAHVFPIGPRERNIDEYWWRIYKSGDLKVLES